MQPRKQTTGELPASRQGVVLACPSCDQRAAGRFCSACGEEKAGGADYSLRRLLGEVLNVITGVESNIFRSFAGLIAKPGFLTSEYCAGRRKPYLKPLQLFLFCNIVFFFLQPYTGFNTLSTPLSVHLHYLPYSRYAREKVDEVVAARGVTLDEYRIRFDATIENQAKTLVILMIPMFALAMLALYWREGRYFVEHLIFSTHFYSFFLLLVPATMLLSQAVVGLARRGLTVPAALLSDFVVTTVMLLLCAAYLFPALRRVYGQGWALTTLKCLILTAGVIVVIQAYRFILFFTTFYSV